MLWFWIMMFICNLLIPVFMWGAGVMMYKCPRQNINYYTGYRTKRSMKNMETWKFAHDYCGRLWVKLGIGMLIPTIVVQLPFIHSSDDTIGLMTVIICVIQIAVLLGSIIPVERALKKKFES